MSSKLNKILVTDGRGQWTETEFPEPQLPQQGIIVESIMTGVCRSDVDMAQGRFQLLPHSMSGHEGLGRVIESSDDKTDVGSIVATRGEPAYADRYAANIGTYVIVPESAARYILEPVACGINVVLQNQQALKSKAGGRLAILGTGFLSQIIVRTLALTGHVFDTDIIGNHNRDKFKVLNRNLIGKYDVIIDLSSRTDYLTPAENLNDNALIIIGSEKTLVDFNLGPLLWKSATIQFPSPRNPNFINSMVQARDWIENGSLVVDNFWTRAYNRNTQWQQAFEHAADRQPGYSRGYICWQ